MGAQNHVNCFLKGALLGSITGSIAALLLAPKSGRELRNDISETMDDVYEKSQHFGEQIKESGYKALHALDRSKGYYEEEEDRSSSMWLGGVFGAILGATSALLLAPQSGEKLRQELGEKYDEIREKAEGFIADVDRKGHNAMEYAEDWKETLSTIINKLTASNSKRRHSDSHIEEIIDWADLGLRVLQQFRNRR